MSVSAPTSSTSTATIGGVNTSSAASGVAGNLKEGDFLNLMMDQMKHQNPLNPADPTQYMGELASFSSLDEQIRIQQSASQSAANQSASSAISLLGQNVSYTDANGNTGSGAVTAVNFSANGPTLTISGTSGISLAEVTGASAGTSASSGTTTSAGTTTSSGTTGP